MTDMAPKSASRDQSIELLRVFAALGIVWFHSTAPGYIIGYAGLEVFILITFYFELGPNLNRGVSPLDLAKRLLVPWAFWWCVYAALFTALKRPIFEVHTGIVGGILSGPWGHLWYLPFIFAMLLLVSLVKQRVPPTVLSVVFGVLACGLILGTPIWRGPSLLIGPPVAQWIHALPLVAVGCLLGLHRRGRLEGVCFLATLIALLVAVFLPYGRVSAVYLLATIIMLAVLCLPRSWRDRVKNVDSLSGKMLGVYLVHPIFLKLFEPITHRVPVAGVIGVFIASVLLVALIQKLSPKVAKWIV